jgi:hypothetical protein
MTKLQSGFRQSHGLCTDLHPLHCLQIRNNMVVVDSHPDCPANSLGQAYVVDNNQQVPWKHSLLFSLVGVSLFGRVSSPPQALLP